ncbi:MAG: penicillin-binding protein 2 [Paludibacteraceae bacterium]|nr:penicillin-binding protein 2 [Paludibacteraceae bacterium]
MINDRFYRRRYVISAIAVGVVLLYVSRLFYLQIIDQSTRDKADNNALLRQTVYPSRGLIYDRNGELLVFNQPIYEVTVITREMGRDFDTLGFCRSLDIDTALFNTRMTAMRKNRGFSRYTPQVFLAQLGKNDVAALQEELYRFPGIGIRKRTLRDYRYNAAAHVLGSVGEVNQRDLDRDAWYSAGDYSGRDGLERTYERELRGEKGVEILMRDSRGRIQGAYKDGQLDQPAHAGTDITVTLDIRLQMLAEELLRGKIGSIVAIEPATGEVLALASNPAWNPRLLVGKERSANYGRLLNDPTKPLMNRATQATYPPGSTFKTLQALVCLQERGITPGTVYPCSGPASSPIKCTHHHGSPVSLTNAIEQSCNPYFWCAFRDMLQHDGYGRQNELFRKRYALWRDDILSFGLGQRFEDSDIGEQSTGSIPSTRLYDKFYGKTGWKAITIRSLSIGQGEILLTPLQLANQAATIANGGWFVTPHLNRHDSLRTRIHHTAVDSVWFPYVQEGMRRVMTNGTGRHHAIDSLHMCGKTGTVQNPHGRDHAIFIGFAPQEHPQIAVAVVVENAGFGATWAAPMASLVMEQYLNDTIARPALRQHMSTTILNEQVQISR